MGSYLRYEGLKCMRLLGGVLRRKIRGERGIYQLRGSPGISRNKRSGPDGYCLAWAASSLGSGKGEWIQKGLKKRRSPGATGDPTPYRVVLQILQ